MSKLTITTPAGVVTKLFLIRYRLLTLTDYDSRDPETMQVGIGITDLIKPAPHSEVVGVEKIFVHEKYDDQLFDYDIGLMKLAKPITFNHPSKALVCLPTSENDIPPVGETAELAGYGMTETGIKSRLQATNVPIRSTKECHAYFDPRVSIRNDLCAGNATVNGCRVSRS